jgi:Tetratricopeptide repeat
MKSSVCDTIMHYEDVAAAHKRRTHERQLTGKVLSPNPERQHHFCDDICAHDHLVVTTVAVGDGDADTARVPLRIVYRRKIERQAIECNRLEIGTPAVKTVKIIATLLIGFFLSVPHAALAQGLFEASDLNKGAIELVNAGRYSEAEPLFKQSLALREKVLGPDHPDVAQSLNNIVIESRLDFLPKSLGRLGQSVSHLRQLDRPYNSGKPEGRSGSPMLLSRR